MTHDTEVTALKACPREPTAEMVEFDALCAILVERKGQEFDGECHLTCAEADRLLSVIALARFALDQLQRAAPAVPVDMAGMVEERLSAGRANNPHEAFSDEAGNWNEGFCAAWEIVRAALSHQQPARGEGHMLRELLAVIHRDGGQYVTEHGLEKAVADATQLSSERLPSEGEDDVARARELLAAEMSPAQGKYIRAGADAGEVPTGSALRAIRAALARAGQDYGRGDIAWLVEREDGNGLSYAMAARWDRDHSKAIRFSRRQDALAFAEANAVPEQGGFASGWCNYTRISEHRWD